MKLAQLGYCRGASSPAKLERLFESQSARIATMALPLPPGLTPPEIAFLCEMELVTVIPRQRLEGLELLGVRVPLQHPAINSPALCHCMEVWL
jgi:hypothetical protein